VKPKVQTPILLKKKKEFTGEKESLSKGLDTKNTSTVSAPQPTVFFMKIICVY
jgi:hypothetical protein